LAAAPAVRAELTERGDLFVRFRGGIDPNALPRTHLAPIAVSVAGTVKTVSGERPPALRRIKIELNKGGAQLQRAAALSLLSAGRGGGSESARSVWRCLGGRRRLYRQDRLSRTGDVPSQGQILAFNGVYHGREVILAHVYGTDPVPITRIIVFYIHRTAGTYGTVLTGNLPDVVNHYGYVEGIALRLHRNYTYRGQRRSYLSAACAAPSGFTAAAFSFARASMTFADDSTLSSTLTRSCGVSG
jgi:hypothetical protein